MRILIAEDDPTSRRVLEAVLARWGHEVVSTADGDEAWARLQEPEAPKLAILDWMMPGKDGVELCRLVRARGDDEPTYVILLTALGTKSDVVQGLDAGADDYLTKPFDKDELRARIRVGERVLELQSALALRVRELEDALGQVKTLRGILPICMYCHKIRTDAQSWERVDQYVSAHTGAEFSHGICEECLAEHYPELLEPEEPATGA
ncbi:MAG: response regulator [Deltaproteobacteria bacterium]|nr:response regulator [Deltaproteobacteria bacterium]